MAVAAQPVNFGTETASGSLVFDSRGGAIGWHVHDRHQVAGAIGSPIEVETETRRHLVPVGQALLIPAGLAHRTTVPAGAQSISVYLDRRALAEPGDRLRLLAMTPLLRELLAYSDRWPLSRPDETDTDDAFFQTFAHVVDGALDEDALAALPNASDPALAAAMAFTRANLRATAGEVARASGMSERTLRRAFEATGMSWRAYQALARAHQARALLARPEPSVLAVAHAVGFENPAAFARAFAAASGETPSAYRRRVSGRCRGASLEVRSLGNGGGAPPPRP